MSVEMKQKAGTNVTPKDDALLYDFLIADSGQGFLVGDDLNIHAGIDGERELLLLIIENLGRREIQFPDHI